MKEYQAHESEEASTDHLPTLQIGDSLLKSTALTEETAKKFTDGFSARTEELSRPFTPARNEDATKTPRAPKGASATSNSLDNPALRSKPQRVVSNPRTVSDYDKPFSKPDNIYTYWYCHNCRDGPMLWEAHVICSSCHHERCQNCSVVHSK